MILYVFCGILGVLVLGLILAEIISVIVDAVNGRRKK